jgi:hypothetical protein
MGACQQRIFKDETAVTLPLLQAIKHELMFNLESARLHDCAGRTHQKPTKSSIERNDVQASAFPDT